MGNGSQNNTINSPHKSLNRLSTVLFYLAILFFIIGFGFKDSVTGNWYQQFMPPINNRPISDITFLDSLTGFAVTPYVANDTAYILKTINGGNNWDVQFRQPTNTVGGFNRIEFLNQDTGFAGGNFIYKTTNAGLNWFPINTPVIAADMSVLSVDTIWFVSTDPLSGGVFYTANAGANWQQQLFLGNQNPSHIYMYNARIGFIDGLKRTTDGGFNWTTIPGEPSLFFDMYFSDSLTGWKCEQEMKKTTDGGLTWFNQTLPSGGNIVINYMLKFSNVNKDTLWGVGGYIFNSGQGNRGMIFHTTNAGNNWFYQIPDTSVNIGRYFHNKFINKLNGWAYAPSTGIHTTTGGDTTFLTGIQQISNYIPKEFKLYQNFPNPFNPLTIINYELQVTNYVKLSVFDIMGKHVIDLVNQRQQAGKYQVDFSGGNISSGVYFYQLTITNEQLTEVYRETRKMILVK